MALKVKSGLWIGTSGFQYKEWKGDFYPEDLSAARMLTYYAKRFGSTEINYSFRKLPSLSSIQKWSAATPEDFRFSFKASQGITHSSRLKDCSAKVERFAEAIAPMGAKVGAVLFQLPPNFQKDVPRLGDFVAQLPKGMRAAFEFRHESWFSDDVYTTLHEAGAALCLAEDEELATPSMATADFGYLRLRREDYQKKDLRQWAAFVQEQEERWSEKYIYFKHEETGVGPRFAAQLKAFLD